MPTRLLDKDSAFVRLIHDDDAAQLVTRGLATAGGKGKKNFVRLTRHTVDTFDGPANIAGGHSLRSSYTERFETVAPIPMLKRIDDRGEMKPWEKDLTFDDLRGNGLPRRCVMRAGFVFETFDENTSTYISKHFTYCTPAIGAELHRQRGFRVRMNDNPGLLGLSEQGEGLYICRTAESR
jgi:hypothetical protein